MTSRSERQQGTDFGASRLAAHPLADLFPLITGPDLAALAGDIATNGLRQPIVLFGDPPRILDGRNRLALFTAAY